MTSHITTIQEFTLRAYELKIFDFLFNQKNMSRDEIFNLFEEWADEFEKEEEKHLMDPDWFYYDEIDEFLGAKIDEYENA